MPCTNKECCMYGKPRPSTCDCSIAPTDQAEFVKQKYGAVVATIRETDDDALEVQDIGDGTYTLTVFDYSNGRHNDMSIRLERKHFAMLGSIAAR
jgi:Ser/Thr protein kinase RdoA (MazF antagonist)